MSFAHAIIASVGWAVLLVAVGGLIVAAMIATISTVIQNVHRTGEPEAVPVWWDQAAVPSLSAQNESPSTS